jgi:NAD(P)-dependent dehydrogenase (short-subunit alcohol dehydrogenase family)
MHSSNSTPGHVLITGCSTGIGRACATYLAGRGFQILAGVRRESDAPTGAGITPICLDVTDEQSIKSAAERVRSIIGALGLKGLVNNAGIAVPGPVEHVPLKDWRRQFEVNFFAHVAMTQAMLPLLRAHVAAAGPWSARIVNISSIAGRIGQPILGPYCASKFALEAMSDSLRVELRDQRIHVSVIEPGAIQSEIWRKGQEQAQQIKIDPMKIAGYEALVEGIAAQTAEAAKSAIPAARVARVVFGCLTARKPRTRVVVGTDAKMGALFKSFVPTRWFDGMIYRMLTKGQAQAAAKSS